MNTSHGNFFYSSLTSLKTTKNGSSPYTLSFTIIDVSRKEFEGFRGFQTSRINFFKYYAKTCCTLLFQNRKKVVRSTHYYFYSKYALMTITSCFLWRNKTIILPLLTFTLITAPNRFIKKDRVWLEMNPMLYWKKLFRESLYSLSLSTRVC